MAIQAIGKFLLAAKSLAKQGIPEEGILKFAQQEFGEVSDLLRLQVKKIFQKKDAPSIKLPEKDEVFDNTVTKLPYDDTGKPFNPRNPLKNKSLNYEEAVKAEEAKAAMDEDYIMKVFDPEDFAVGGRVGFKIGTGKKLGIAGIEKGKEVVDKVKKFVNDKLGKDTVKTADELDQPPKTEQQSVSEFEARNPNPKREMTPDEYEDFVEEVGGADQLEAYNFDGTIGDAKRILKEQDDRMKYMYDQYRTGKLDPVAGDKSPARKRFLQQKFDEMEASGDSRLMTREEIEELSTFDLGTEMQTLRDGKTKSIIPKDEYAEYSKDFDKEILGKTDDIDISQGMIDLDEMNFTKNAKAAKEAIDNASINDEIKRGVADVMSDTSPAGLAKSIEIDNLMLEYPGISKDFADQIASSSPTMKADMIAMVEQAFKMDQIGMSGDEIIDAFKKGTDRTKQANGGLSYLMGM